MSTHKSVAKSAGLISAGTLLSRVLGLIRDIVIARLFGVYVYAQAFVIAFRIPNLFRDLVGEGSANSALVPVFSEYNVKKTREEFWGLANVVLNLLLVILMSITLLGIIFSPVIVRLIAPGFISDPEKLAITIRLNRIIFPYIVLISLAAYSTAILNSLKHFSVPAFAPCLLNISIVVSALMFGEGIKGLALGVLVGGALQLLVQIPVLYKKGFRFRLPLRFRHPGARQIGKLMVPRLASSGIYQLNNFADSIFGSLAWIVGEGGVAVLYFSYRLIQFPIGIFSNALSQAILPTFSTQALEDTHHNLKKSLSWGLRATFFVMLPSSAAFVVLSYQLIDTLFGGGRFDRYSAQATASALAFYSIGLAAYGGIKILQSCFFALKDTVTPAKTAFLSLVLNVAFCLTLMFPMKISGLALATSLSGTITFMVLFCILNKRLKDFNFSEVIRSFVKILLSSAGMGAVCYFASLLSPNKYISLAVSLAAGFISYIAFCLIFRVAEMKELWVWVLKRK
jgi:putative peptidoglycan lipid II flippase